MAFRIPSSWSRLRLQSHFAHRRAYAASARSTRTRLLSILAFTSAGGLTATYFLWPSEYRGAPTFRTKSISPSHFTPLTVISNEPCGSTLKLLTLKIPPEALPTPSDSPIGPIWSVFIKDDDIQVERPYTPLEGIDDEGNIKLWVKKYPRGEVGRWLHSKGVGDTVEIRGPLSTFPYTQGKWDEVILISGGTGFSPFHQLLHRELLQKQNNGVQTRFTLLHGSPSSAELPPSAYLQPLVRMADSNPERLRIRLFVDSLSDSATSPVPFSQLSAGRIGKHDIEQALGLGADSGRSWWRWLSRSQSTVQSADIHQKNVLILVCGPEPMVASIAGPYGRNFSQGAVGGALAELGFKAGQVWKL
ncbi:ferredoxin reductase-like C-terminal NADP-linked domain-containing protein [Auriscalpium vulgare]|uniref:Ferredoxin reductase-like C-terminal NADP-linked domain-containing protein n=1 Tax=Auriscalpium vulgare TaxID=40419 RepID=A0ACB8SA25_9AGAM|nr:ferredoxin reductase-like C-terminal NADP-linked domain-containing protein [Auriscalpium vulgare]